MIIQPRSQGFSLKTFSGWLLLIWFIQLKFSSKMRRNPTVRVFVALFIRYGVNTYSCMRYVSLHQLFTENNAAVISQ